MTKNRYFIVNYAATTKDEERFLGSTVIITEGTFVNKKRLFNFIKDEGNANGTEITLVLMTSLMELTEKDYLDWYE